VFGPGDIVRLVRETNGMASGSQGEVIGWYTDEPHRVLVRLWDGGVQRIPQDAVEKIERAGGAERPG
jgi:hypothetical protein